MFKKIILTLIVFAPLSLQAFDFSDFYWKGGGGFNFFTPPSVPNVTQEMRIGYAAGGAIGCRPPGIARFEAELMYRDNEFGFLVLHWQDDSFPIERTGHISSLSYMVNMLADFPKSWVLSPYIGGGLGGMTGWSRCCFNAPNFGIDNEHDSDKCRGFACQAIAGFQLWSNRKIDAVFEYHFVVFVVDSTSIYNHTLAAFCRCCF